MCSTESILAESKRALDEMFRQLVGSIALDDPDVQSGLERPIALTAELLRLFVDDLEEAALQRLRQEERRERLLAA